MREERKEMNNSYLRIKNRVLLAQGAVLFLYLFIMAYSFSLPLGEFIYQLSRNSVIAVSLYLFVLYVFYFLISFGLNFYGEFLQAKKFQIKDEEFGEWAKDLLRRQGIIFIALLFVVQVTYFFLETQPKTWWLLNAAFWIVIIIFKNEIFPFYILPLILRYAPLSDENLKSKIIALAQKAGVTIQDVCRIKPGFHLRTPIVMFSGVNPNRKMLLDDIFCDYTQEEVGIAVLQELARNYYQHRWKLAGCRALFTLLVFAGAGVMFKPAARFFGFKLIFDIGAFPVLALLFLCGAGIFIVIFNDLSRRFTRKEDDFVLSKSGQTEAFISVLVRQANESNRDQNPGYLAEKLLFDKPAFSQRILTIQDYAHNLQFKQGDNQENKEDKSSP
ncbi:MAG: hypothetical protein KKF93_02915 [Candidatus Omnitrophica bacterium]|nr:hypothetical protein [Candidatus Omnitrophota bacterium]